MGAAVAIHASVAFSSDSSRTGRGVRPKSQSNAHMATRIPAIRAASTLTVFVVFSAILP